MSDVAKQTRRSVLMGGAALPFLRLRAALAQGGPSLNRAAVMIGVDQTGDLPRLRAAAADARKMQAWLADEGFEVRPFVDDEGPVRLSAIQAAVDELVEQGNLDQLVIYFAGHGVFTQWTDSWLLSLAPRYHNEAINLAASRLLADRTGIPNVVFIADACRLLPNDLGHALIQGSSIFPHLDFPAVQKTYVDKFLATQLGEVALEASLAERAEVVGVFTDIFLEAFANPEDTMVEEIGGQLVVPNERLEGYLQREVPLRAEALGLRHRQVPHCLVLAKRPPHFIGRAPDPGPTQPSPTGYPDFAEAEPLSLNTVVAVELDSLGVTALASAYAELTPAAFAGLRQQMAASFVGGNPALSPEALRFEQALDRLQSAAAEADTDLETGFRVVGTEVAAAVGGPSLGTILPVVPDREALLVDPQVVLDLPPMSTALLIFADGSGAVLPIIQGFVASVVVEDGGVVQVSYAPSIYHSLRQGYDRERERLDALRSVAAAAARFGAFRFDGVREARRLQIGEWGNHVRYHRQLDPSLCLYSAYAYQQASLPEGIKSILDFKRDDRALAADLFDIALLARLFAVDDSSNTPIIPFCPMLTQGWSLLAIADLGMAPEIREAGQHLRSSLWTTFDRHGIARLRRAIEIGAIGPWGHLRHGWGMG